MRTIIPNYYDNFKCIADKCRHNCCIGWEIDIDEKTLKMYKDFKGNFSKRLNDGIHFNDDYACFKLDGKGRCVFLNKDNLCDIILNSGEDHLCQICADHPRFRNFYKNATEIGLGLCCEEAGRIILGQDEDFELIFNKNNEKLTDEEEVFFDYKYSILHNLQNKELSLNDRILILMRDNDIEPSTTEISKWIDFFLSLERLDEAWTNLLCDMKKTDFEDVTLSDNFDKVFEKMLLYFIYRHLEDVDEYMVHFAVFCVYFISQICRYHIKKYGNLEFEDIVEYARMYSSEIEYSDENITKIYNKL